MASLLTWLDTQTMIAGGAAALLAVAAALGIALTADWRALLALLPAGYVGSALLLGNVADARAGLVLLILGLFVWLVLLVTAAQAGWGRARSDEDENGDPDPLPDAATRRVPLLLIRAGVLLFIVAGAWLAGTLWPLPNLAAAASTTVYALLPLGLATTIGTRDPFKAGSGILLVLLGLNLFAGRLSLTVSAQLVIAGLHLLTALVTAYLTQRAARQAIAAFSNR